MKPLFLSAQNPLLLEARQARFRPHPLLQILIFLAVSLAVQMGVGTLMVYPTVFWTLSNLDWSDVAAFADPAATAAAIVSSRSAWLALISLFATVAEIEIPILYCRCIERRSLRSMGLVRKGFLRRYGLGFLLGAGMLLAAGGLAALMGTASFRLNATVPALYILLFLAGYLVQGMAEEMLLRGYFMVSLANRAPVALAVGVSSVVFALLHLGNPGITALALVNLTLFGVFAGLFVLRTGSIAGACAIHSAWNFFQGNVLGVSVSGLSAQPSVLVCTAAESGALWNGGAFGLEGGLCVTLVLLAGVLLVLLLPARDAEGAAAER